MTKARSTQIILEATNYYHCFNRVVRAAWLIGDDPKTGEKFEHRREWIESRILLLTQIFAIDVAAYAVMSNHYHIVLAIQKEEAMAWSTQEVIERWHRLYCGTHLTREYLAGKNLGVAELNAVEAKAEIWRERLYETGWFMRNINEYVARKANKEDDCKGRFWEGRYKCQALLDEKAILSCMMYVDLNPIRAKMHNKIETSKYTSIKKRCEQAKKTNQPNKLNNQVNTLLNFAGKPKKDMPKGIPCELTTYLELIDWTGKQIKSGKRGRIDGKSASFLNQLNIEPDNWVISVNQFAGRFSRLVGMMETLEKNWENFDIKNSMRKLSCKSLFG